MELHYKAIVDNKGWKVSSIEVDRLEKLKELKRVLIDENEWGDAAQVSFYENSSVNNSTSGQLALTTKMSAVLTGNSEQNPLYVIVLLPKLQDHSSRKRRAEDLADAAAILVRRMELASRRGRPQRTLSYVTKSAAFHSNIVQKRVSFNVPYFLNLIDKKFETDAFKTPCPAITEDENTIHHPYFLRELAKLVAAAVAAGVEVRQRVYLSRARKWLSLDDGISSGVEPDFCTTDAFPNHAETVLVPSDKTPVSPPASKYDVELTLEAKKAFTDTDQIEAIDYSERILCTQRGRSVAYGALFHCCGEEKNIRWIKTYEVDGEFKSEISEPAMLGPGLSGSTQLLTMLTKSRKELGRPFPSRLTSNAGDALTVQSWVGEGATSHVYIASRGEQVGVVKSLKPGHEDRASREVGVLELLDKQGVTHILPGELVTRSSIYFPKVLIPPDVISYEMVKGLVSLLEAAHAASVFHRDVRPDNIMRDETGNVYLIDWGCAHMLDGSSAAPPFEGTFRFASDAVLSAALSGEYRMPEATDDLESLVRSVLAVNSPDLLRRLVEMKDGDFAAAKQFWREKRRNHHFDDLCRAAQRLDYEYMRHQLVIW